MSQAIRETSAFPRVQFTFQHHVLPPLIGLFTGVLLYGALNFPWVMAQIQYRLPSRTTSSAPAAVTVVDNTAELTVPSIHVKAPIIFESSANNTTIAYDLRSGVVHYAGTAMPGQQGNAVIFGHSSGLAWAPGSYKFVFTLLEKLKPGDQVLLAYHGTNYIYQVTDKQVVAPNDFSILRQTTQPELSLVTCTPVGTSKNRLVVHARQLRPKPAANQLLPSNNYRPAGLLPSN